MVSLKIEVKKKDVTWAVFLVVMLAVGVVYAYGTSNPSVMGHSWREINFDDDFCKYVTGSNCVGGGACVDTSWSPNSNTICSGDSFTQTSNCGNTRTTVGTMSCAPSCVPDGQLAEVGPAPYQNCQGGTYPRTSIQYNTEAWTNCCSGTISRLCAVPGYSTQNTIICGAPSCVPAGQLAEVDPSPYQNCQGGTYPRTSIQYNTEAWTNCCSGTISRLCAVPGYSTQNTIMCA